MNAVAQPIDEMEKKIRRFIEAVLMVKPDLKDKLNIAACIQYLQMPDSTFGWDPNSSKTPGAMSIEYKIACLMPTVINGLPPGCIIWMGKPYATAEAYNFVARRDIRPLSGISYRLPTPDERAMYFLNEKDMCVISSVEVLIDGVSMVIEGLGIIGTDESQPNNHGKYKVARELTRDRAQFVRTRAVRDMWRRHISISGVPSEEDYYEVPAVETAVAHDPQKIIDLQRSPSKSIDHEANKAAQGDALNTYLNTLVQKVHELGGRITDIVGEGPVATEVMIKFLEVWIAKQNPEPEPPAGKRKRRTKEEMLADQAKPMTPEVIVSDVGEARPINPMNQIDETVTAEEVEEIVSQEPVLHDFNLDFPDSEPTDAFYTATEEQKQWIRNAVKDHGLPQTVEMLTALSASMRGHQMSKLAAKAKALGQNLTVKEKAEVSNPPSTDDKTRLRDLLTKMDKMGAKPDVIIGSDDSWEIWNSGNATEVKSAIAKLEDFYKKILMGKKP